MKKHYSNYFYGNKVSDYGIQNGYVDYATLAKAFDAVLNNDIMQKTCEIGYWEQESGFVDNSEQIDEIREQIEELEEKADNLTEEMNDYENPHDDAYTDIERKIEKLKEEIEELEEKIEELEEEQDYYPEIYQYYIVSDGGARILEEINEIVFYNEELDIYIWGITHWGTSWDYVLTDIKICEEYEG